MVRTKGARLGLAHADAIEPHATPALADERLIVERRSQDHPSSRKHERRRTEDHREALDGPSQDDSEARHGEARDGETHPSKARRPQDDGSPQDHRALDREAHDAPQLRDTQEAPLSQVRY